MNGRRVIRSLKALWPLWSALLLLAVTAALTLRACLAGTGGHFVYALDDPYITMAMAKNLVRHGTWGVTPSSFSSSCSSPLWLLSVAATYAVFGVNELSPLVLNLALAALLLVVCHASWRAAGVAPTVIAIGLAALVFLVPLVPMAITGLEHPLHAVLSVAFVHQAARALGAPPARSRCRRLALLALLAVACRYESLFLVAPAALLFAHRRRFGEAAWLVAMAALPVLAYGLFSTAHGWTFLPVSILLKGQRPVAGWPGVAGILGLNAARALAPAPHLVAPIALGAAVLLAAARGKEGPLDAPRLMIAIAIVATLLHADFARVGNFFRYDAYLVALLVVALGAATPRLGQWLERAVRAGPPYVIAAVAAIAIVALPLVNRGQAAQQQTARASSEIYRQQYQMGLFLRRFFDHRHVAANDIGAIDYLAAIDSFDLAGLGDIQVARARLAGRYDTRAIDRLTRAHGVELAILYDKWFEPFGGLPREWIEVGAWTLADTVVVGGATVSFYAVGPRLAGALTASLRAFSSQLPAGVAQSGAYVTAPPLPR
jgi:hypothetical protein